MNISGELGAVGGQMLLFYGPAGTSEMLFAGSLDDLTERPS